MQKGQEGTSKPILNQNFDLEGSNANKLLNRIILRLKVQKVVKHWKKLCKNSFNRFKRIQEWVNTQKAYIDDLKIIVNNIEKPLREKNIISEDEQRIIFPNMNGIIMLSEQMHSTMKQILEKWHPFKTEIAPAVIKLSSFFKIYIQYFNNYLKGKQILDNVKGRSQVKDIEKKLKMDFDSYLSKPTQRPVKYKLLLTDYQKKLRSDHPDYNALTKAISIYHQVVQKTNQALQNEKKMRRMILIESKFKNILESSRQWKFQFDAWFQDEQNYCKIYAFTDLLIIVSNKNQRQDLQCKMFIDGNSFVQACEDTIDEKKKKIFAVGKQLNGYFFFSEIEQRNRIFQQLSKMIHSLHVNQWKRKQMISKVESRRFTRASSQRLSKTPFQSDGHYEVYNEYNMLKKKFRVTVAGVQRRCMNKCKNYYFVIRLQLPFPQVINQKALVKFEDLEDLQFLLKQSFNKWRLVKQNMQKLNWKSVSQIPKNILKGTPYEQDSQIVEYRITRIQYFLNFILRNKQTLTCSNLIFHKLKMFESLFEYLTDDKSECMLCQICQNGDIISNFQTYQKQQKQRMFLKEHDKQTSFCIYRSFHSQNRLASQKKQNSRCTCQQILVFINSKLGSINFNLTNRICQGQPLRINIFRPRYRDLQNQNKQIRQKWIEIKIFKKDTVGLVLEMLRQELNLKGVRDFGLILINNEQNSFLLNQDEYVYDVIKQNNLSIQVSNQEDIRKQSTFKNFFSKIKDKFSSQIESARSKIPSARIQLRKIFVFNYQVQSLTCASDGFRRRIICDQIFYMFKNKDINLSHQNSVKLCSLFICIEHNQRLKYLKRSDINFQLLSQIFPYTRTHVINQSVLNQIWSTIEIYQRNSIQKLQLLQTKLISLINDVQGWNTQFFLVENLTITAGYGLTDRYLKLGINFESLLVTKCDKTLLNLLKISLDRLKIKYSGFVMSITYQQKQYQFLCDNMFSFRSVLQKYQAYNKFFLGKDKVTDRPIMQQTI